MEKDKEAISEIVNKLVVSKLYATTAINDLEKLVESARIEAIGWAYADCCVDLDKGKNPRKNNMPDVLNRALNDLSK